MLNPGWKALFPASQQTDQEGFSATPLPQLTQGDTVDCREARLDEKQTSPPKHFTDATLLAAMTGIARFVVDKDIKKVLRETDGLGTEATRAGIIELLFKRQFLSRKGKEIRATEIGRSLINTLPERMVVPDMTAHWESQLEAISEKKLRYQEFMLPLSEGLNQLIAELDTADFQQLNGLGKRPAPRRGKRRSPGTRKRRVTDQQAAN